MIPSDLKALTETAGQQHLLQFWGELTDPERQSLRDEIGKCDFALLHEIWNSSRVGATDSVADNSDPPQDRARLASAPRSVIRQPDSSASRADWADADAVGTAELSGGTVGIVTVAGGQGTRLGFDLPKGMFPIGPVTGRTLFQIFAEQLLARCRRHRSRIPWYIMTSDATHEETLRFFESQRYFGLTADMVHLFCQGSLPALDADTGRILMSGKGQLALSPDGHGGLISALKSSGLLAEMERQGIQHLFYHQVDNPTTILANPALIGWHVLKQSEVTTNVVRKRFPQERMGVLVELDGRTEIIEYSELTAEDVERRDSSGDHVFWAGNTAIHVFDRQFLQSVAGSRNGLPLHVARKNVPWIDAAGQLHRPSTADPPNALKLERFIFDTLPVARRTLIVEGDRDREFNPVKNASGPDSPETARQALSGLARDWAGKAGLIVPDGCPLELSPLTALDEQEFIDRVRQGKAGLHDLNTTCAPEMPAE